VVDAVAQTQPYMATSQAASTAPLKEALENLDDPELLDWEAEGFDFGDEPQDESWDIWGCYHKFRPLTRNLLHDKWMTCLDPLQPEVECMMCFQKAIVPERVNKPKRERAGTQQDSVAIANQETPVAQPQAEEPIPLADKMKITYECEYCGVVCCGSCRKVARSRNSKQVRDASHS